MKISEIEGKEYIAIVEDNLDPKKMGRVRARVVNMFDDLNTEQLPWASPINDLNGNQFNIPDVGKLVTISFHNGSPYKPEYKSARHYNANIQAMLDGMSDEEYASFKGIFVDHQTQIYRTSGKGLVIDNEQSNINITNNGDIKLNLRDGGSKLYLGTEDAQQAVILGTNFMDWMDSFLDILMNGGFLGNMMKPLVPKPDLLKAIAEFKGKMRSEFLSNSVWVPENGMIKGQGRPYDNSMGDNVRSNYFTVPYSGSEGGYQVEERDENPLHQNFEGIPNDDIQYTISDDSTTNSGKYPNGRIPSSAMVKNKHLAKNLRGNSAYLLPEASKALDAMMAAYNNSSFGGKHPITFTDGYRDLAQQQRMVAKYGIGRAARVGTSKHGLGIAIDMWWGVPTKIHKTRGEIGFIHPVYQWMHLNAHKFGWYNPEKLRSKNSSNPEWWHFEYLGNKGKPAPLISKYAPRKYTDEEIRFIKKIGGSYKA